MICEKWGYVYSAYWKFIEFTYYWWCYEYLRIFNPEKTLDFEAKIIDDSICIEILINRERKKNEF